MVPRKVEELPKEVELARKIILTLGDYCSLSPEEARTSSMAGSACSIAQLFVSVGDIYEYSREISKVFVQCFSQLSVQIPILSLLVALMHRKEVEVEAEVEESKGNSDVAVEDASEMQPMAQDSKRFCEELVNRQLREHLLASIRSGETLKTRLLLRAVACLYSCRTFSASSFLHILSALLAATNLEKDGNGQREEALQLCGGAADALFLLASTVPWCIGPLVEAAEGEALLLRVEAVLAAAMGEDGRGWAEWGSPFRCEGKQAVFLASPSAPYEGEEQLLSVDPSNTRPGLARDALAEACAMALRLLRSARALGPPYRPSHRCQVSPWTVPQAKELLDQPLLRPLSFGEEALQEELLGAFRSFNGALVAATSTSSSTSTSTAAVTGLRGSAVHFRGDWLTLKFCLFDQETSPEAERLCRDLSPLDRYLAATFYADILHFFQPMVNDDGTRSGSTELLANHLLAVARLFPAQPEEEDKEELRAPLEYLLVEVVFQRLLQPPSHLALAGHAGLFKLLLILCRSHPSIPPVVAIGTNILFQSCPDLHPVCWREFARWFSFHLTNTKLSWPYWDFWLGELRDSLAAGEGEGGGEGGGGERGTSAVALVIKAVVDRCTRISIPEKMKSALPSQLHDFIPRVDAPPLCPLLHTSSSSTSTSSALAREESSVSSFGASEQIQIQGGGGEEVTTLDDSIVSADSTMAVAEPPTSSSLSFSTAAAAEPSPATLAQLAQSVKDLIEAKTDPEDIEDWFTANRREVWSLFMGE